MHASYINNNDNYTGNNNGNGNEKDNDNNMSTLTWFLFGELKTLWPIFVRNCPFCTIWWKSVGKLNKRSRKKSFLGQMTKTFEPTHQATNPTDLGLEDLTKS